MPSARETLFWTHGQLRGRCADGPKPFDRAAQFAVLDAAWRSFLRDAGAREFGLHHSRSPHDDHILLTEDPRADAMLDHLARHAIGDLADAAGRLLAARSYPGRALGRFNAEERKMLEAARHRFDDAEVDFQGPPPVSQLMKAIAHFREDYRFAAEGLGESAERGGGWAINLGLLTMQKNEAVTGIVPRAALRIDERLDDSVLTD